MVYTPLFTNIAGKLPEYHCFREILKAVTERNNSKLFQLTVHILIESDLFLTTMCRDVSQKLQLPEFQPFLIS